MYICVLPRGWDVCVCVSYVEGGMCICVLPRGWHVCVFPMWNVVYTYAFYLMDGVYGCVSYVEGGMCICVLPRK